MQTHLPDSGPDGAAALIQRLALARHPEGGWYRELHRSSTGVRREGDGAARQGLTVIVFLLERGDHSGWHRVRGSDEVWHHAGGAPLELWRLPPDGGGAESLRLGALTSTQGVQEPMAVVPANWWQAARSLGDWSLVHCCVGPAFDFADFTLLRDLPTAERPQGALESLL